MAALTGEIVYPHPPPELDRLQELAPGLLWLRTALPFALDHINIWILDEGSSWTVIDTGVGDAATRALWDRLLDGPLAGKPLGRVVVTHFHPDHFGQAGHLCARSDAPLLMARTEYLLGRALACDGGRSFVTGGVAFDRRMGLPEALVAQRAARGNVYRRSMGGEPPAGFVRLQAGETLALGGSAARIIVGEGHAPEQLTFHDPGRGLLVAADQILPKITPVIGVWAMQPDADPLSDFLASLDRYRDLPEDVLVLPSHGRPFRGLRARLAELGRHHEERLDRTLGLLAVPATGETVMRGLFRRELSVQDIGFALAETLAHLNTLQVRGLATREPGADGAWRFRRA